MKPVRGVRSPTARTPEVGLGVCGAGRPPGFYGPNPLFSVPEGDQPRPRFSCRGTNCHEVASSPRHSLPTTAGAGVRGSAAEKAAPTANMWKTRTSGRGQAASSGPCVSGILSTNAAGSSEPSAGGRAAEPSSYAESRLGTTGEVVDIMRGSGRNPVCSGGRTGTRRIHFNRSAHTE